MFTHGSYADGYRQLEINRRVGDSTLVTWDAGDGWRGEGYYCPRRRRVILATRSLSDPNIVIL
jgi:hypothetical protein